MYLKKTSFVLFFLFAFIIKNHAQIVASSTTGCAPLTVNFSGPAGATNIFWNLATGTSNQTAPSAIYNNAGNFTITYTAIVNGNPVNYSQQISVKPIPTGNFSYQMSPIGCAPRSVTFTASGGSAGSNFNWSYGDLTSTIGGASNVVHTYNNVGSYVPVVSIVDAQTGCIGLAAPPSPGTIIVSSPPNVVIGSSNGNIGCNPPFNTVISGSLSSGSANALPLNYNWNLSGGNPSSSSATNPGTVSFGTGTHTISLTITDNNNCSNSSSMVVTVTTPSLVVVAPPSVCADYNPNITFTVTSSHPNVNWVSNTAMITNIYTVLPTGTPASFVVGNYTVGGNQTYTVSINPGGICPTMSVTGSLFVEKVTAQYTAAVAYPTVVCSNPFTGTFQNISTTNSGATLTFTWSSILPANSPPYNHIAPSVSVTSNPSVSPVFTLTQGSNNPYTIYNLFDPGISLIAQSNSPMQCKDLSPAWFGWYSLWRPTAWFNKSKMEGCVPLSLVFRDSSDYCNPSFPITGYTLYFGTSPQTSVTGTTGSFTVPFTYTAPGVYHPYLVIQTVGGCTATSFTDDVTVSAPPSVSGTLLATSACAGQLVTINMAATPTTVNHWHVDADQHFFSGCVTNPNPSFPFTHIGTQTVAVTGYQTGCSASTAVSGNINIKGPWGQTRFQTTCVGTKKDVTFYSYLQDVQTAVLNFGDNSSTTLTGVPGSTIYLSTLHSYSASGIYNATLTSIAPASNLCSNHVFTVQVKIRTPDANILFNGTALPTLPNALACVTNSYNFTGSTSIDVDATCRTGYVWNLTSPTHTMYTFQNSTGELLFTNYNGPPFYHTAPPWSGPPTPPPYTVFDSITGDIFQSPGIYTISLTVRDANGCADTETKLFRISSAKPQFTFNINPVCLSAGSVQVINTTQNTQVNPDVITNYTVNFGGGLGSIYTSTNSAFSPTHAYSFAFPPSQIFTVTVNAKNSLNCEGSDSHTLQVNNPYAGFTPINPANFFPCLKKDIPTTVNFTASAGYVTYSLNFADPPSSPWQTLNSFGSIPHVYNTPGITHPTLIVTDATGCKGTQVLTITAIGQASVAISFSNSPHKDNKFCLYEMLYADASVTLNQTPYTNTLWTTVWGNSGLPSIIGQNLITTGVFPISLSTNWNGYCQTTYTDLVYVADPKAKLVLDKNKFCLGDVIQVSIKDTSQLGGWQWFFGDYVPQQEVTVGNFTTSLLPNPYPYTYSIYPVLANPTDTTFLSLYYFDRGKACKRSDRTPITVIKIESDFKTQNNSYIHCVGLKDEYLCTFANPLKLNLNYSWSFNGLQTGTSPTVAYTFTQSGFYPVSLTVTNPELGCNSTSVKNLTVLPQPKANIFVTDTACPKTTYTVAGSATPGVSGEVKGIVKFNTTIDSVKFTSSNNFSFNTSAIASTSYSLIVTDNNGCVSKPAIDSIYIQQKIPQVDWDTTVIIGETIPLNAFSGKNFSYTWTPIAQDLSCLNCYNPISNTTVNLTYSVLIEDKPLGCFINQNTYKITINPKTSLDVPSAFTPNADGINDIIYLGGWGIRKVIYFKIFNRWGQLLFQTNDQKTGWDGYFEGVPQNMETYVYEAAVETYLDTKLTKSGTIKIIR